MAIRQRNYHAEETRRNDIYRALGFTSRAQARGARRKGTLPSAAEIRRSPAAQAEVNARRQAWEHRQERLASGGASAIGSGNLGDADRDFLSRQWSDRHSRKESSRWDGNWSRKRKHQYYAGLVDGFTLPHDERDFGPLNDYYDEYIDYEPDREDSSPYPHE